MIGWGVQEDVERHSLWHGNNATWYTSTDSGLISSPIKYQSIEVVLGMHCM